MVGRLLVGAMMAVLGAWSVRHLLRPARAVWRGDPSGIRVSPSVAPASYIAFLTWAVPLMAGVGLIGLAVLLIPLFGGAVGLPGLALLALAVPGVAAHIAVSAGNRPRFLVPPPYRDARGWLIALVTRRR
ncbi:hypothetical protein [Dactylosporangium sp. CS-033363]|uniref:hypothetical protein n=1 Tax=Dactylosporangium sp. CS-033363 TaxID=3239935 RepID=UPI003D936833